MTHVIAVDNRVKSSTKGEDVSIPVTILECPDMKVAALRLYSSDSEEGLRAMFDVWSDSQDVALSRTTCLPKNGGKHKISEVEAQLDKVVDIVLLVNTQPEQTSMSRKKPELFEVHLGGSDVNTKFAYAKEILGKTISIDQVFKSGQYLDVHAVSKGKGFCGVVKRFNIKLRQHKSEKGQRRTGAMGPRTPHRTFWWYAMAGQMGYNTRTEYNKRIIKIAEGKQDSITPDGGIVNYGIVNGKYILLAGSVPGAKRRLVRLSPAVRLHPVEQVASIVAVSKRSQQ
jgi:large subunit ribosomal protein L3